LVLPFCNIEAMNLHLAEISQAVAADAHAVLLVDQAGWHISDRLAVPDNLSIVLLPPKSPELNPTEKMWSAVKGKDLANYAATDIADLWRAARCGLRRIRRNPTLLWAFLAAAGLTIPST